MGRATERLIQAIAKRRNRQLFDQANSEAENMRLLNLLEEAFGRSEGEISQFLDLSRDPVEAELGEPVRFAV